MTDISAYQIANSKDEAHDLHSTSPKPQHAVSKSIVINFRLRLFLFCLIEASFIVLGAACLADPLTITVGINDTKVKGGFTVVFIAWHSLAVLVGGCIPTDAFSREWSMQSQNVIPGTTDRVSTITSGMIDRISHIFTKQASGTFKLAFLASLTLMALNTFAPGTIITEEINVTIPVDVAKQVSQISDDNVERFHVCSKRANLIVRLEKTAFTHFGFKIPPNTLVSLPPQLVEFSRALEYSTDIVNFHHECHWEAPSIRQDRFISAAGYLWNTAGCLWNTSNTLLLGPPTLLGSSISPLSLTSYTAVMNTSTTAYLFIGGNSSYGGSDTDTKPYAIDLGEIPAFFNHDTIGIASESGKKLAGPLASVLVCNANTSISNGRVHLATDGTVNVSSSVQPPDGSFPSSAANIIFSTALQDTLVKFDASSPLTNLVNDVAADIFMVDNSFDDWNNGQNVSIPPLDISSINKNMDEFMSSAAKAFIDGYWQIGPSANTTFNSTSVSSTGPKQQLALKTSKDWFITTILLDSIAIVLLYILCRSPVALKGYPFDLNSISRVLLDNPA